MMIRCKYKWSLDRVSGKPHGAHLQTTRPLSHGTRLGSISYLELLWSVPTGAACRPPGQQSQERPPPGGSLFEQVGRDRSALSFNGFNFTLLVQR